MPTNEEYYFGTKENASLMEVKLFSSPMRVSVRRKIGFQAWLHIKNFDTLTEYVAWLHAEYDDGTIKWDDDDD